MQDLVIPSCKVCNNSANEELVLISDTYSSARNQNRYNTWTRNLNREYCKDTRSIQIVFLTVKYFKDVWMKIKKKQSLMNTKHGKKHGLFITYNILFKVEPKLKIWVILNHCTTNNDPNNRSISFWLRNLSLIHQLLRLYLTNTIKL